MPGRARLLAVPYHLGKRGVGSGEGPARLVATGAASELRAAREVVVETLELGDGGAGPAGGEARSLWNEVGASFALNRRLASRVRDTLGSGELPLVLAGDCNACLGIRAGAGDGPLAVAWFDAHGDFNTPETSPSGFFDGMALAAMTGRCWRALARTLPGFVPVPEERVLLVGARDLDPEEREALGRSQIRSLSVAEVRGGRTEPLREAFGRAEPDAPPLYLHVDLDVLDPSEGIANAYAAPGGLTLEELSGAIRTLRERFTLRTAALTAYDPACDVDGRAGRAALRVLRVIAEPLG